MITVTAQCAGTIKVKLWKGTSEEESLKATSGNKQRVQTWHVGTDCFKYSLGQFKRRLKTHFFGLWDHSALWHYFL